MTTPPPAVPARVVDAILKYKWALVFRPAAEADEYNKLVTAIIEEIEAARQTAEQQDTCYHRYDAVDEVVKCTKCGRLA